VVATKDYHPHDHCSFIGCCPEEWPGKPNYPPHCVQGHVGANFYQPIAVTLCELMRNDAERAKVAWKGFHEGVDSFGGAMYNPDSDKGRFPAVYGKPVGCQMSVWTGSFILKSSNMTAWNGPITPSNVDAPPDILAVQHKKALHDFVSEQGCTRVFVCGVALDICVVDTCLNMLQQGFDQVAMVIDAARPAHNYAFGTFGSGFLNDPTPVATWIREAEVPLVLTCGILAEQTMKVLQHRGVPVQNVTGVSNEAPQSPSSYAALKFPTSLHIKLVRAGLVSLTIETKVAPTSTAGGTYTLQNIHTESIIKLTGYSTEGSLSPVSPVTLETEEEKRRTDLPDGAVSFAYAHSLQGSESVVQQIQDSGQSLQIFNDPNVSFAIFGGFVYFDKSSQIVGCTARVPYSSTGMVDALPFKEPKPEWQDNALMEKLHADGRFQPVSSPYEQGGGALQSAWVLPGEGIVADNTKGGFVYTFADTPPKWYPL